MLKQHWKKQHLYYFNHARMHKSSVRIAEIRGRTPEKDKAEIR